MSVLLIFCLSLSCFCYFRMSAVKMTEGSVQVESCSAPLFYRRSEPSDARMSVLLLHGIRFSSENWLNIGTMDTLAKAGCCAVAIDLPELGRSKSAKGPAAVGELAPAGFLKEVCEKLNLLPVVVISPSLSGMYSLPFLLEYQDLVRAYIPVAPICTEKFTAEQYQRVKTAECQGQVTSRRVWLVLNRSPAPFLSTHDRLISQQTRLPSPVSV
ncbi:protein ABHD14B isoform X2 [Oryzias melastigma]|uniref:protein ABHD14B isoform X2 n=1 Tax=Oryzias melastigma TaxID=30732 RepID=UPI00168CC8C9|nr:protein ABHD14B isoform X2 [Oryzias melastigma]